MMNADTGLPDGVFSYQKNPLRAFFVAPCNGKGWYVFGHSGIFSVHLVYLGVIW
jgi:hypothetical protein